jgi:uncharacterized protein YraI
MSENINQVFIANPITTNASTDLMYFGQSPYLPGNDAAMTFANFAAQFASAIALLDGQVVIGSSIGPPLAANIIAGSGITITNGHNTITISTNGASPWIDEAGATVTMTKNTGYTSDDGATLVTFTLPTTAAVGDWIEINGKGSGGWTLIEGAGQIIHFGNQITTLTTGSISSTNQWDCIRLRCVTANTTFTVVSAVGNLTIV